SRDRGLGAKSAARTATSSAATVTPEVQQAVDGFAPLHIGNTGPHSLHGSGDLKARHDRSAVLAVRIGPRGVPGELGRSDGGSVDPDQGLPRRDARLGTVFVDQSLGSASRMTSNGFHDSASLASRGTARIGNNLAASVEAVR